MVLCGFATGCAFSLCMAFIGLRTRTAADASRLSGMLQSVGYAFAALGPVLVGRALDLSGSWTLPLAFLLAGVLVNTAAGQLAGKPGYVEPLPGGERLTADTARGPSASPPDR